MKYFYGSNGGVDMSDGSRMGKERQGMQEEREKRRWSLNKVKREGELVEVVRVSGTVSGSFEVVSICRSLSGHLSS